MKRIVLLGVFTVLFLFGLNAQAQTASYNFSVLSGTFSSIAATGTATGAISGDDLNLSGIPIGFSFTFCGLPYSSVSACSNGWLSLANSGSNTWVNVSGNVASAGWLMPYWDDLHGNPFGGPVGTAYYQTTGLPGSRIFTFEWATWGSFTGTGSANFQVKLYEGSTTIDFCYGPTSYGGKTATIGIANDAVADFKTVDAAGASATAATFTVAFPSGVPDGTIYRWSQCPVTVTATNDGPLCPGATAHFTGVVGGGGTSWNWSGPGGFASTSLTPTISPVTAASAGVYTLSASNGVCSTVVTTPLIVNSGPAPFAITPSSASICGGSQMLVAPLTTAAVETLITYPSIHGSFVIPDATASGATDFLTVAGIPASWSIVRAAVVLNNISMTFDGDLDFGIRAPNTNILNIFNRDGGGGDNFVNTEISSIGVSSLVTGIPPFTGLFAADAALGVGPTGFASNVNTWPPLYSTPNGNWTLVCRDNAGADIATVNNWSLKLTYSYPSTATYTWAPLTGLYLDAAMTIPYTGTSVYTVYAGPTVTTTYTATATVTGVPCTTTSTATINITALPIGGTTNVCVGTPSTLTDGTPGGTWTSSNTGVGTINSATGVFTGIAPGTTTVFYNLPGCAASTVVTVNANPSAISGVFTTCVALTTTLSNAISGGTYISSNTGVATVGLSTGIVTGVSPGTSTITYTVGPGCFVTAVVTVGTISAITGTPVVCMGLTTPLGHPTAGGTWTSSASGTASVVATTGVVTGVAAGTARITYTLPSSCYSTIIVTVNPLPAAIGGSLAVCVGTTSVLTDATAGGTWTSGNTAVATIGASSGAVTGVTGGTSIITYTLSTGCIRTAIVTVNTVAPITGTAFICVGLTATLADATAGGTWTSSTPGVATVNSSTGVVTGVSGPGTSTITYTVTATGCFTTAIATVNAAPAPITGAPYYVCSGLTLTIADATIGGTWSSITPAVAIVDAAGVVTGVSAGTSVIDYSLGAGCTSTVVVTVNASPAPIAGVSPICAGGTITLTDPTPFGTWSSSAGATITAGGVATGGAGGTPTITYTIPAIAPMPTGCYATAVLTVNPLPAAITGTVSFCQGTATTLANATAGGTWSSSNGAVANADPATGVITGLAAGTSSIIYTLPTGCTRARTVTVNPAPAAIGGTLGMCEGVCTTLTDATTGGTWSSSTPGIASIGSSNGILCGAFAGNAVITYTASSGCFTVAIATVYSTPPGITGVATVCPGTTTTLANAISGGTWSSGAPGAGSVTITSTGVVMGGTVGTTTVTYTTTGCTTTRVVTVIPLPSTITGTTSLCVGYTTTLADATAPGTWSSSNTAVATVGTGGIVSGVTGGTSVITFTANSSGCYVTTTVTVNPAPLAITATSFTVCVGLTTTMSDATAGGAWSVGAPATGVATITSGGVLTGGTAGTVTVTYTAPVTGCMATAIVTVNPLPGTITGIAAICAGFTTTFSNSTAGGTWSSSNTAVATVGVTGIINGVSGGTSTITYTLGSGCIATRVVTVNDLPAAIGGAPSVCIGSTTALTDATTGGTWISSTPSVATVGSSSGIVTGIATGTTNITYTITATGCITTMVMTVYPVPAAITGTLSVCPGNVTTLADVTAGGNWASGNPSVASVDAVTGVVTGSSAGTAVISYILSATGCFRTATVTVNPLPGSITGTMAVCVGSATLLSASTPGGTWISGSTAIATVGSASGIVTGISAGTVIISYKITATGCQLTTIVTVNPLPSVIGGALTVCPGTTTTLTDSAAGGTWSTTATSTISLGASTGVVTGLVSGTARVTYTLGTGCLRTIVVTVNPLPAAIGGATTVCPGGTALVTDATTGGTWSVGSPATGAATINAASGLVTGGTPGTVTITYTLPTGCSITTIMTVNALPAPISGGLAICTGLTTTLSDASAPGTWASSTTSIAIINASGVVTGNSPGTSTITFTESATTCYTTAVVTVNGLPPAITGIKTLCPLTTTTLFDAASGGTWSSSTPAVATIGSSNGIVNGVAAGTSTITYTIGSGCIITTVVTVNPLPAPISGALGVCIGLTGTLSDATAGGTWISGTPAIASVGSATGIVSGNVVGTSIITYALTATGCYVTAVETVNPLPANITGSNAFCNLTSTFYHSTSAGGTWTSGDPSIVTIDAVTGEATGVSPGTATITYTLPTGCIKTKTITIILAPYPITGATDVCVGSTITLGNPIGGGTWTSSSPANATIDIDSASVYGVSPGTTVITYVLSTGCFSTYDVTVNLTPTAITGNLEVCYGLTTTLANGTPGGAWSSSTPAVATISGSGVATGVSAGTSTITYAMSTGCNAMAVLTVNPLPAPITGVFEICLGLTTTLSDTATGGTWTSSNGAVAAANPSTGVVAGLDPGTATITYTLPTGCIITQDVTVNPLPAPITGILDVCIGLSVTLNDATGTGTWSSSDPSVAPIDAAGVVTGMSAGTTTITYMLATGCVSTVALTVNALPPAITGNLMVCAGFTSNLSNTSTGGTWTTDGTAAGVGTIHPTTGVVTGIAPGTMNITYTLPSGCLTTAVVTVNVLPSPVTGSFSVCAGATTSLSDPDAGGTWSSSNPAVGTVDLITGVVSGIAAGVTEITYTFITTGCINKAIVTVNPLPAPITGLDVVCEGSTITLHDITAPGSGGWSSSNMSVAYFAAPFDGILTGASAGTTTVSYTLPFTGCSATKVITVNPLPAVITGPNGVCLGYTVTLNDATTGGTWISSNPAAAPISVTGVVSGLALGTTNITYTLSTGCLRTKPMTVNALPPVHTVTGGGTFCAGGAGVHIGLNGSDIGISYLLYYGGGVSATGYVAGTGGPLDFGLHTVAGVYTVIATNAVTGCFKKMQDTAVVIVNPSATPIVDIHTNSGTDTVCPGAPTLFTVTVAAGDSSAARLWRVNGTIVSIAASYSYLPANGDVVSVRLTSTLACAVPTQVSDSMKVTVLPAAIPVATIGITPGDTVCEYTPTTFTGSATFGGSLPQYMWYVNGYAVGTGSMYNYIPNDGDVVSLKLKSNYQCRLADSVMSTNATMSVHPLLIPHVDIVTYPGLAVAAGENDSLATIVSNAGSHPTYQWHINSIPVPGATNAYYVGTFHDYDSVACIVTSSDVCHGISSFDWVFITIHPTGVTNVVSAASDIRLIPNPNKGVFSVKGSLGSGVDEEVVLEVTDMLGQVVYKNGVLARKGRVEEQVTLGGNLANGMYMLSIRSANQNKVFHFVVEQ